MLLMNVHLLNFSNRAIGTITLERHFPSSIADTMSWFQNSMSDLSVYFTSRPIQNQNFMVTLYTNSKRLWVGLIFGSVSKNNNTSQVYWLLFKCYSTACMLGD